MNARVNELLEDLRQEVALVKHLIDEVTHLNDMRRAHLKATAKLEAAQNAQREYFQQSRLPLTPENIAFLNSTWQGQHYQQNIVASTQNIELINTHVSHLQDERNFRMKPLNDLVDHVSVPNGKINTDYIGALLNTARVLNPEGSILDRLKMIGNIIVNIITLRFQEISVDYAAQKKRNQLRTSVSGLFHSRQLKELPAAIEQAKNVLLIR